MYHAACKVEFQPFNRSYSQLTFFNYFLKLVNTWTWWCYLLSYRDKRSINYPAQRKPYNILPPAERRDLWAVSVDGSPYTVVRAYPSFDPNPGDPGRHIYNMTHEQALLLKEIFEVGFALVSSTMPNVMDGATFWATPSKRSIDYPAQGKPYNIIEYSSDRTRRSAGCPTC